MTDFFKYSGVNYHATSAQQLAGSVYFNTLSGTTQFSVVNGVIVNPNGTMTTTPGTYVSGGYGVGTIGYAPPVPPAGIVEVTITNGKGTSQTMWAMVDNGRISVFTTEDFSRIDGSDLSIGEADAGNGTQEESDDQAPHWSPHYR